jgi:hypothetical protein
MPCASLLHVLSLYRMVIVIMIMMVMVHQMVTHLQLLVHVKKVSVNRDDTLCDFA